jgi:UDP-glucose 4-epimerase
MEVIRTVSEITGRQIPLQASDRRPGDAPVLSASNQRALKVLGWSPKDSTLDNIVASAWKWHRKMRGIEQVKDPRRRARD